MLIPREKFTHLTSRDRGEPLASDRRATKETQPFKKVAMMVLARD